MLIGIVAFIVGIFVMILAHEAGHFVAARAFGIKVEEFFLGFGPRLWSFRRKGTEYGVKALPLGGYVRIAGMNPLEEPPPEDHGRTFTSKPKWQRAIVLVAGAATHFVLAFVALFVLFAAIGIPTRFGALVAEVEPKLKGERSPAAIAGLEPGDEILAIDGQPVDYETFPRAIDQSVGEKISITVRRGEEEITLNARPVLAEVEGERTGRLGISFQSGLVLERERLSPLDALGESSRAIGVGVVGSFQAMGRVFGPEGIGRVGEALVGDRERSLEDPVGVVGAARVAGQAVEAGFFDVFLQMFAFFNIFVGLLNLMPLPPLDGGHLAVLGIEAVRRRPIDPRRLVPLTALVAGFLILFTVALLYLDIAAPVPNLFQ